MPASVRRVGVAITGSVLATLVTATATIAPATAAPIRTNRYIWPQAGESAYSLGDQPTKSSPRRSEVPIASVAKVMTAYVVLSAHPMNARGGFRMTVSTADVADTARRASEHQSIVPVRAGERLT